MTATLSPRHALSLAKCRKIKADLLSETARAYAQGAAKFEDVEQAAREFVAAEQGLLNSIGGGR